MRPHCSPVCGESGTDLMRRKADQPCRFFDRTPANNSSHNIYYCFKSVLFTLISGRTLLAFWKHKRIRVSEDVGCSEWRKWDAGALRRTIW